MKSLPVAAVVVAMFASCALAGSAAASVQQGNPVATPSRQGDVVIEDVAWTQDGDGKNGATVVVVVCDHCGSVTFHDTCNDPGQTAATCTGKPVGCPKGFEWWSVHTVPFGGIPGEDTTTYYCHNPAIPVIPDVQQAQGRAALTVPAVQVQPAHVGLPVHLDAYFSTAPAPVIDARDVQPAGTVEIKSSPGTQPHYYWNFGDPASGNRNTLDTTDPGGPYPNAAVTHRYDHKADYVVTLRVGYVLEAYVTVAETGQTFGPFAVVPSPVVTLASSNAAVHVIEAHAVLVG